MIDRDSHLPIYYQIEKYIRQLIENHDLQPGDLIPSERELTELFHVSRMTVRQAVLNLVNEGTLIRLKGKGTFISDQQVAETASKHKTFADEMRARGQIPGNQLNTFRFVAADSHTAHLLNIHEHDPVYEIRQTLLGDTTPVAVQTVYLSANLIKGLTEDIINESLDNYIQNTLKYTIDRTEELISATSADVRLAELLQVNTGSPLLTIERVSFLENNNPLELTITHYHPDRYQYRIKR